MALGGTVGRRGAAAALGVVSLAMLGGAITYVAQGDGQANRSLLRNPDAAHDRAVEMFSPDCPKGSAVQQMVASAVVPTAGDADSSTTPEQALQRGAGALLAMAFPEYPHAGFQRIGGTDTYIAFGYRVGEDLRAVVTVSQYGNGWLADSYRACTRTNAGPSIVASLPE